MSAPDLQEIIDYVRSQPYRTLREIIRAFDKRGYNGHAVRAAVSAAVAAGAVKINNGPRRVTYVVVGADAKAVKPVSRARVKWTPPSEPAQHPHWPVPKVEAIAVPNPAPAWSIAA